MSGPNQRRQERRQAYRCLFVYLAAYVLLWWLLATWFH